MRTMHDNCLQKWWGCFFAIRWKIFRPLVRKYYFCYQCANLLKKLDLGQLKNFTTPQTKWEWSLSSNYQKQSKNTLKSREKAKNSLGIALFVILENHNSLESLFSMSWTLAAYSKVKTVEKVFSARAEPLWRTQKSKRSRKSFQHELNPCGVLKSQNGRESLFSTSWTLVAYSKVKTAEKVFSARADPLRRTQKSKWSRQSFQHEAETLRRTQASQV